MGRGLCPSHLGLGVTVAARGGGAGTALRTPGPVGSAGRTGRSASRRRQPSCPWGGGGQGLRPAARGCRGPAEQTHPAWGPWRVRRRSPPSLPSSHRGHFFFFFFFHLPKVYINSFILSSFKHVVHWSRVRVVYKTVPPIAPSLLWVFASRERGGQRVWVRRAPRPAWSRLLLRLLCKGKVRTILMARKVPS